ncbi:hypothetical protein AN958_07415 [Leucoagaricus sp. SymC.cos]|nr:hypothetical protein AN958_07415 [Leucoagaricus sp. SymC.cos]
MPLECAGKDEKVKVFLRQLANHDRSLIQPPTPVLEPPTMKGYLNKYTNVAKGYNTRYFVLNHGVLSYYRHQDDESITSRGSISMKNAYLKTSAQHNPTNNSTFSNNRNNSSTRFEIHSLPAGQSSSSSSQQKWYIKASHPTEASRWIQAIRGSIEWYKNAASVNVGESGAGPEEMQRRPSNESARSDSRSMYSKPRPPIPSRAPTLPPGAAALAARGSDTDSINLALSPDPNLSADLAGFGVLGTDVAGAGAGWSGEGENDEDLETSSADTGARPLGGGGGGPPHEAPYELTKNGLIVQVEAVQQLLNGFLGSLPSTTSIGASLAPPPAPMMITASSSRSITSTSIKSSSATSSSSSSSLPQPHPRLQQPPLSSQEEIKSTLITSLSTIHNLLTTYTSMTNDREQYFKKQLISERKRQRVWEESLAFVVKEGASLEEELRVRSRRRGSRVFGPTGSEFLPGSGVGAGRRSSTVRVGAGSSTLRGARGVVPEEEVVLDEKNEEGRERKGGVFGGPVVASPTPQALAFVVDKDKGKEVKRKREGTTDTVTLTTRVPIQSQSAIKTQPEDEEDAEYDSQNDSEDEFFDAIEQNTIPNLIIPTSLNISSSHPTSPAYLPPFINTLPYTGYTTLREKLSPMADDRPPTSLWSVLKHSIGQDLTRISFPVFFNEPTSMLQRMAEDMEFSECLDTAATQRDSLKRLAFVAAFAMSNYSSTIGRIAKPFNPMLSETFEYVRLDKKYRYVSEQVSHHPPISACWAESPLWHYFGEVDAQNKFMGKSFEIRPTGVAHAELVIPESWVPPNVKKTYPKAKGVIGEGKVVEHYTWKKVTTNVSGFILGSPTIDHYGDMIITNHRTNERCMLTFKPRGWRGKDAYEISGQVIDAQGRLVYEIAGRWNSQLIMREVGKGYEGALNPDMSVGPSPTDSTPLSPVNTNIPQYHHQNHTRKPSHPPPHHHHQHNEYILLWKNSTKPIGSPFNLTSFAISLNDCPPHTLRPYLAPTDCRLRPDQRAFELGRYDLANELKFRQEEKQRATRRERDMGRRKGHVPRWFVSDTCGDTGERVWMPKRTKVRMRVDTREDVREGEKEGEGNVVEEERVEYWVERERVWKEKQDANADGEEGKGVWKGVEEIFIDDPQEIKELILN